MIASAIPGRIRVRDPAFRDAALLEWFVSEASSLAGVSGVIANRKAGSVLIRFDPIWDDLDEWQRRIERVANGIHGHAAGPDEVTQAVATKEPVAPAAGRRRGFDPSATPRVRANRAAKRGMLVSMAASLAFAATGRKRWHIRTGGGFLVFLAVHLWVHRSHLLR